MTSHGRSEREPRDPEVAPTINHDRKSLWLSRGRDIGVAVFAAAMILLATPPVDLWPLGLVGLIALHLGTRDASTNRALFVGWVCGFIVNAVAFSWGSDLVRRFVHISATESAAIVIALAVYQAVVFALWLGAASLLQRRLGVSRIVSAPLAIIVAEASVPFIFPWYLAIIAVPAWPVLQVAELGGPPAVSGFLVLITAVAAEGLVLLTNRLRAVDSSVLSFAFGVRNAASSRHVGVGAIVAAAIFAAGLARAGHVAWARDSAPTVRVGVVQPNFGIVSPKARTERGAEYMKALRDATAEASQSGATLIVWPESAFPFLIDRDLDREYPPGHPWELRASHSGRLLVGALTHEFGTSVVENSTVLISDHGKITGIYDKTRLLAFGEYVPFADRYPEWAADMRARMDDWPEIVPGTGPRILKDGNLRIASLICYEDLLPDYVHQAARKNPNLLVTSANHAWFGTSAAAPQALALATLRGVETRRDFVRATATGVSSISDALGRVSQTTRLFDGDPDSKDPAEVIVGDVALMEVFALAPHFAWLFPYLCGAGLLWVGVRASNKRRALQKS